MAFSELFPKRVSCASKFSNSIRVSFRKVSGKGIYTVHIFIGIDLANKMKLKEGVYCRFFVDDENPRNWMLVKSRDNIGYRTSNPSKKNKLCLSIQTIWREFVPSEKDRRVRKVNHEIIDNGIRIYLGD